MSGVHTPSLNPEVRGWLRHLWRKATTADDWSYGLLLLVRKTPAQRVPLLRR